MLKWVTEYQHKSADCRAIVLATIFNPQYQQKIIYYAESELSSKLLVKSVFNKLLEEPEAHEDRPTPKKPNEPVDVDEFDVFGWSNDQWAKSSSLVLEHFLQGWFTIKKKTND